MAETAGLKPKQVTEVVEAMMAVVATEFKLVGTCKIAGALSMKLKKKPAHTEKLVKLKQRIFVCRAKPERNVATFRITKKFRLEMQKTCGDSTD